MKTMKTALIFFGIFFFHPEIGSAQRTDANNNQYSTEGFYVRQNGNWWFPIGTYFEAFPDPVTEEFFKSIREYFDAYYVSLKTLDYQGGVGVTDPADLDDDTAVWLPTGISYFMRRDTAGTDPLNGCIAPGRIADSDPLGPEDQAYAATRLNDTKGYEILDAISAIAESTGKDIIFMLPDEPDRGNSFPLTPSTSLANWYFHGDLLKRFTDLKLGSRTGSLTYLDLGPTSGSKLIFNRIYPDSINRLSNCLNEYLHSASYPTIDRNLDTTISEYESSSDIIGINNYYATISNPAALGRNVKRLLNLPSEKPVWPWVSLEHERYSSPSVMFNNARRQTYSAIANRAAGIFYYGSVENSSDYWDSAFDLIKEINLYQYILCQRSNYDWNAAYDIKWRTVQIDDRFFMFAINDTNIARTINASQFGTLTLNGYECGVWTAKNDTVRKLSSPLNLSFEQSLSSISADSNWLYYGQAQSSTDEHKMEAKALKLRDSSNNSQTRVEQFFNCVPGYTYEVKVWYKTDDAVIGQTGSQRLILQYYNGGTWLSESPAVETTTVLEWTQLSVSMEAPANATKAKIHIDSGSQVSYQNSVYWDDVVVEMSLTSSSPKIIAQGTNLASPENALASNYPNPFNPATTINFDVASEQLVVLRIYNSMGELVSTLIDEKMQPGLHIVKWNGEDSDGNKVPNGVYMYRLSIGNVSKTYKMTLLK